MWYVSFERIDSLSIMSLYLMTLSLSRIDSLSIMSVSFECACISLGTFIVPEALGQFTTHCNTLATHCNTRQHVSFNTFSTPEAFGHSSQTDSKFKTRSRESRIDALERERESYRRLSLARSLSLSLSRKRESLRPMT